MVDIQSEFMIDTINNTIHMVFKLPNGDYVHRNLFEFQQWFDDNREWINSLKEEYNGKNTSQTI